MNNFNVKYYTNEAKRVVVAVIEETAYDLIQECEERGHCEVTLYIPNSFSGKATCSVGDKFDVEKGKKIAFKRAYKKYVQAKRAAMKEMTRYLERRHNDYMKFANELIQKYDVAIERRTAEIEALIAE